MAGIGFEISETGVKRTVFDLEGIGKRAADVRPAATKIRTIVHQSAERRFDRQGPGWPKLAEATKQKKEFLGQDPRMLRVTSTLFRSLTSSSGPEQVDERHRDVLRFGTTVEYARFHDLGTRKMPQRKLVDLTASERRRIDRLIEEWIAKGRT